MDISNKSDVSLFDNIYDNVLLKDIFNLVNSHYLFIIANDNMIPALFQTYMESPYDLFTIIPWIQAPLEDNTLVDLVSKHKKNLKFVLVFSLPKTRNIKSLLSTIIIEPENCLSLNPWQRKLVSKFNEWEYTGSIITSKGYVEELIPYIPVSTNMSKIKLF